MRFRPKRKKCQRFQSFPEMMPFNVDEPSDDDFDVPEPPRLFGPAAPPSPPHSSEEQRQQKVKYTRDVLRLTLHHGDILIQQGPELQKRYEVRVPKGQADGKHAAVPKGMRIVATARYINTDIHGSSNHPTMEAATAPVPVSPGDLQITSNSPPSPPEFEPPTTTQIEPKMNHEFPSTGPPLPAPFQSRACFPYNHLETFHGKLQSPWPSNPFEWTTPSRFPPHPPFESGRIPGGGVPLYDHFPGLNSKGAGMFPLSSVREEQPPVIVASHEAYPRLRGLISDLD